MSGKRAKKVLTKPKAATINNGSSIFQANVNILKKRYPEIFELIDKLPPDNPFEMRSSSNKMPNLWFPGSGFYYYDTVDPMKDSGEQIQALQLKNTRLALFLGMGLAYEVFYYLQNTAPQQRTNNVLILERDPYIFRAALKTVDITQLLEHPDIHFIVGIEQENLFVRFMSYLKEDSKFRLLLAMKPVYHTSSLRLHKDYYLKALQMFREAATHMILDFGNDPEDSLIGVENMLANLGEIVSNPGINLLNGKFHNKPGIVVATGPSLNKNKHLLKGLEDKALIIAVDASLRIMIDMGVKPHLVTSLERMMPTVKLLEGFTEKEVEDVYLAACPVVRPEMYQAYPGPRIIVYRNFDHFRWLNIDKGILNIKASAGNMAFKVAEALGCNPIILLGQDLAFSRDGYTHASGTTYGENQNTVNQTILEIPGNDGQPIQTTRTWFSFLKAYEVDVANYQGDCINCTEGGAYIPGTTVMPFAQAIDKFINEEIIPGQVIKNAVQEFTSQQAQQDIEQTLNLIDNTIADLEEIIDNCRKGIEIYENYKEILEQALSDVETLNEIRSRIDSMETEMLAPKKACQQQHQTFQLFFAHIFQSFAIKFEMGLYAVAEKYDDYDQARVEVLIQQIRWYAVIGKLAGICVQALQKAHKALNDMGTNSSCIEELKK
ncbi:MAG: 6-hydroxymethylpterin diphosphokinase MptE-like protein [Syntrophomonadaceae bacterium]